MALAVSAENLSKQYRLGELNRNTLLCDVLASVLKRIVSGEHFTYETIWALKDVSFELEEGNVLGIIGRNGAGKSTLLKVLSKITYPTAGSMKVRGRVASLLEVGTGFHDELTGRENIYLNGSILGMKRSEIRSKLDSIAAFADVEQFLDTPVKRYSSGMRLRLGFAVAAHLEPDVLLVDEVLAVGDAGFQKKCLGAMDDLHSGGRTVMFVSHNLAAVENLCPRTIWIENGQVQMDADSKEVIQAYLATFADASKGGADLSELEHRKGGGEMRCVRIELLDSDGSPASFVRSGMELTFRLHYQVFRSVQEPHFGIEIYSNLGTMVTSVNTWTSGLNIPSLKPGKGHIDVRVGQLNLNPGRYYLSIWLASVGPRYYDHLDFCTTVSVEPADVNNSGRAMNKGFGLIYMPCQWSYNGLKHPPVFDAGRPDCNCNDPKRIVYSKS
jgi:lipopolysaccharide transport system ATP-binding protein